jgi:hypothetical protein
MWITASFRNDGIPATGLSATLNITRVSDNIPVVSSGVMTEIADGAYKYNFTGYEITEDYFVLCDGGPTLSDYERYTDGTSGEYNNTLYSIDTTISGIDVKTESIDTKVDIIDLTADTIKSTTDDIKSTVDDVDVRTLLIRKIQTNRLELVDGSSGNWKLYDDNSTDVLLVFNITDKDGNTIVQPVGAPSKRSKGS